MDPDDGNHEPNRKGCRREAGSGGSVTQTPGPRYTKRIGGTYPWARRHKDSKPDSHPEGMGYMRRVDGRKAGAQYPGRSVRRPLVLLPS